MMVRGKTQKTIPTAVIRPTMKYQEKANQILKYSPLDALKAGTRIAVSGRSDFPNQINNAVVFSSVLRALLDTGAKGLDEDMLVAASCAIASLVE
jgi:malate dehydrogenase (oxaloacetate-decarboxylating)